MGGWVWFGLVWFGLVWFGLVWMRWVGLGSESRLARGNIGGVAVPRCW